MAANARAGAPARPRPITASPLLLAALLSATALLLYLLTFSRHYSPDTMAFAVLTTDATTPSARGGLVPAEHVGYPSVGWAWYQLWRSAGYGGGSLAALQALNAIAGAVGVGLMYLIAHRTLASRHHTGLLAAGAAVTLGASYAYWYHSTEGEDQTLANTLLLAACYLLLVSRGALRPRRWLLAGGGLLAAAVLAHATHVLFLPAAALLLTGGPGWRKRVAAYAAAFGPVLLTGYLLAAALAGRLSSASAFWDWLWAARGSGVWGRPAWNNVWQGAKALATSVVYTAGGPNLRALARGELELGNLLALVALLLIVGGAGLAMLYALRVARRRRDATVAGIAAWAAVYGAFNLYWAPEDVQFWTAVLPPLLLLTMQPLAALPPTLRLAAPALGLGLLAANLGLQQWERHQLASNTGYWQALCVRDNTQPNDLVLTSGWGWAGNYLRYFGQRQVFSLLDAYLVDAQRDQAALVELAEERMRQAQANGGRIYLAQVFDPPLEEQRWLQERVGLLPSDFPWPRREAFVCGGETIWSTYGGDSPRLAPP